MRSGMMMLGGLRAVFRQPEILTRALDLRTTIAPAAAVIIIARLTRAFRWRWILESGTFATINELAAAEKIDPS